MPEKKITGARLLLPDYKELIERTRKKLTGFDEIASRIPHEKKGVLYSDILFMLACLDGIDVGRVLESGRARGQSTLLMAKAFPQAKIISVEFDSSSADVSIANERLKDLDNVTLLFGDSRQLLPAVVKQGDVVIIDGPKMFLAIRLALKLLATKKVSHVFIHDMTMGTPWRAFLNKFFPEARFSDHKGIAEFSSQIDEPIKDVLEERYRLGGFDGEYGYGYALACVPLVSSRSYNCLRVLSFFYDLFEPSPLIRIRRKFGKILRLKN